MAHRSASTETQEMRRENKEGMRKETVSNKKVRKGFKGPCSIPLHPKKENVHELSKEHLAKTDPKNVISDECSLKSGKKPKPYYKYPS